MPPKKKEHAALGKPLITQKEFTQMTYTANGVIGVIETLRNSLAKLEQQIKADEDVLARHQMRWVPQKQLRLGVKASQAKSKPPRDGGGIAASYSS